MLGKIFLIKVIWPNMWDIIIQNVTCEESSQLKGLAFRPGIKWHSFPSTQCWIINPSTLCGEVSSVICSVLPTLQYRTHISLRSSSSILAVGEKIVYGSRFTNREEGDCEEEEKKGAGLVLSYDFLCTWRKNNILSLAQIKTTTNTLSYKHEPVSSQPRVKMVWISGEIKFYSSVSPTDAFIHTHTYTHTHAYLKSGLRKNNTFIPQQKK